MKTFLLAILFILAMVNFSYAEKITCEGDLARVGFLPQYSGKAISIDTNYRSNIWAKTVSEDKADIVVSILLSALISGKKTLIQFDTLGSTSCEEIEQYNWGVIIDRVFIYK